jgi:hypothetical protein
MVLLAGFTLLFAWLVRCRLYPGKKPEIPHAGITDDRFVMVFRAPHSGNGTLEVQKLLQELHVLDLEERREEKEP